MPGAASAQLTNLIQGTQPPGSDSPVARALQLMRSHLGMEVAYVSEFVDDRSVFREVDAPGLEALIKVGDSQSLDDVYCRHILAGRLPQLIPDTSQEPICVSLPITARLSKFCQSPMGRLPRCRLIRPGIGGGVCPDRVVS